MKLTEEEKLDITKICLGIIEEYLLAHEIKILDDFLRIIDLTREQYMQIGLSMVYIKNERIEIDNIGTEFNSFNKHVEDSIKTENDYQQVIDFDKLTPQLTALYAEVLQQKYSDDKVMEYHVLCLSNLSKINDRLGDMAPPYYMDWISIFEERIRKLKLIMSDSKQVKKLKKEVVRKLDWNGSESDLTKVSKKLYKLKLTKLPTDFEKVFLDNKEINWIGNIHVLAHLLHSLHHQEVKSLITSNSGTGYFETAIEYFYFCDSNSEPINNINLSDLAYKVRNAKKRHQHVKDTVNSIIKKISTSTI